MLRQGFRQAADPQLYATSRLQYEPIGRSATASTQSRILLVLPVTLNAGSNRIEFRASAARPAALYLDNIRLSH
jgi:hypothetical protein